ncbi:MAG: MerC family mercury resistance protein, partial [Novosphingobium sp.]
MNTTRAATAKSHRASARGRGEAAVMSEAPAPPQQKAQAGFWAYLARCNTITYMAVFMRDALLSIRSRLDRFGVLLSGLCMLHCLAGLLLVAGLGLGGQFLFAPVIHRVGLALA